MSSSNNLSKLLALVIVGGVAKSMFGEGERNYNFNFPKTEKADEEDVPVAPVESKGGFEI